MSDSCDDELTAAIQQMDLEERQVNSPIANQARAAVIATVLRQKLGEMSRAELSQETDNKTYESGIVVKRVRIRGFDCRGFIRLAHEAREAASFAARSPGTAVASEDKVRAQYRAVVRLADKPVVPATDTWGFGPKGTLTLREKERGLNVTQLVRHAKAFRHLAGDQG